jgi:hypothetical protein
VRNPPCRENDRYFDFKHLKFCAQIDICNIFVSRVPWPLLNTPLPLGNYIRIVALAPELWKVLLYGATQFLQHGSTTELLLLLMLKRVDPGFNARYYAGTSSLASGCCGTKLHVTLLRGRYLKPKRLTILG